MNSTTLKPELNRIEIIDAFRGFALAGLMLGRMRFFENTSRYTKQLKAAMKWSGAGLAVVIAFSAILFFTIDASNITGLDSWIVMIGLTLYDLLNLSLTVIVLSLFILTFHRISGARLFSHFIPYGRTALTNYVLQSVIGTAIFYGWGLGLLGDIRNIHTLSIAFGIVVLQIVVSKLWLKKFRYGPLEWVWRMLTYGKWFSVRNK